MLQVSDRSSRRAERIPKAIPVAIASTTSIAPVRSVILSCIWIRDSIQARIIRKALQTISHLCAFDISSFAFIYKAATSHHRFMIGDDLWPVSNPYLL